MDISLFKYPIAILIGLYMFISCGSSDRVRIYLEPESNVVACRLFKDGSMNAMFLGRYQRDDERVYLEVCECRQGWTYEELIARNRDCFTDYSLKSQSRDISPSPVDSAYGPGPKQIIIQNAQSIQNEIH